MFYTSGPIIADQKRKLHHPCSLGEVCEEATPPFHPCDETWFPDAAQIADAACDILDSDPFAECHALVDVLTAKNNCKYDVCSCYDEDCACPNIKQYVQACLDAGVTSVLRWREVAGNCPLTCESPFTYHDCGSNCPASCGDRKPDCGRGRLPFDIHDEFKLYLNNSYLNVC